MSHIRTIYLEILPVLFMLTAVSGVGLSILVWLAPIPSSEITPAQNHLINIADWMVKAAIGAILGFSGARLAARGSSQST